LRGLAASLHRPVIPSWARVLLGKHVCWPIHDVAFATAGLVSIGLSSYRLLYHNSKIKALGNPRRTGAAARVGTAGWDERMAAWYSVPTPRTVVPRMLLCRWSGMSGALDVRVVRMQHASVLSSLQVVAEGFGLRGYHRDRRCCHESGHLGRKNPKEEARTLIASSESLIASRLRQ
jgi:hypothetical protein